MALYSVAGTRDLISIVLLIIGLLESLIKKDINVLVKFKVFM